MATSTVLLDRYRYPGKKWFIEVKYFIVAHFKPKSAISVIRCYEMKENIRQFVRNSLPKLFEGELHDSLSR